MSRNERMCRPTVFLHSSSADELPFLKIVKENHISNFCPEHSKVCTIYVCCSLVGVGEWRIKPDSNPCHILGDVS